MQRIYTNHFALYREGTSDVTAQAALQAIEDWLRRDVEKRTGKKDVTWRLIRRSGKNALLAIVEYPYEAKDGPRFMTIKLGRLGDEVKVQLDVAAGKDDSIGPWRGPRQQPELVPYLAKLFELRHKGRPLETEATDVLPHQAKDFVELRIRQPDRQLPLVVLAEARELAAGRAANGKNTYLIDPDALARKLIGVAQVYCFPVETTFKVRDLLGLKWNCYDGAARLYWPGWNPSDSLYMHPLFLKESLLEEEAKGRDPAIAIIRRVHELACASGGEDPIFRRIRDELTQEATDQIQKLADGESRLRAMEIDRDSWKARAEELEAQLEGLRKAWSGFQAAEQETKEEAVAAILASCRTAEDVLHLATKRLPHVQIWTTAWREAHGYQSRHLEELYLVLEVLDELAQDNARKVGGLGMTFDQYLAKKETEKGRRLPKHSLRESQTTLEKYRADRTFSNGGRTQVMERHFTIGPGDSEGCLHVYYELEGDHVALGYVGRHLKYVKEHG